MQIDSRVSRTQYQYTLQDADEAELSPMGAETARRSLRELPELTDVASDQQPGGLQVNVDVDREKASRLNILPQAIDDTLYDAFGQRQVSTIFTQLNQYRVILEAEPQFPDSPRIARQDLREIIHRPDGAAERFRHDANVRNRAADHRAPRPIPGRDALLQSCARALRSASAVKAIQKAEQEIGLPETVVTTFSGSAAEFRSSLKSEPFLILAAIVVIYIVLGVLYESYIHPITILSSLPSAGVGALLALMLTAASIFR